MLVIGAAHVDVIADYDSARSARLDKTGTVRYSIGGTAYNIAVNLGQSGVPVRLLTVLRRNSFPTMWIEERLEAAGVSRSLLQLRDNVTDSGFVALRRDRELESAVTSSSMSDCALPVGLLDDAVASARLVVFDCNLPEDQIGLVVSHALRHKRPVVAAAVSDSKVKRLIGRPQDDLKLDLVALNCHELAAAGVVLAFAQVKDVDARRVCGLLRTRRVVLTYGEQGHLVLGDDATVQRFPAPTVEQFVSSTGAGDALLAGVVTYWYEHQSADFDRMLPTVESAVRRVLRQEGATVGSLASEADFAGIARLARRREPLMKRLLTQEVGVIAGIMSMLFAALALPNCHGPDAEKALRASGGTAPDVSAPLPNSAPRPPPPAAAP